MRKSIRRLKFEKKMKKLQARNGLHWLSSRAERRVANHRQFYRLNMCKECGYRRVKTQNESNGCGNISLLAAAEVLLVRLSQVSPQPPLINRPRDWTTDLQQRKWCRWQRRPRNPACNGSHSAASTEPLCLSSCFVALYYVPTSIPPRGSLMTFFSLRASVSRLCT